MGQNVTLLSIILQWSSFSLLTLLQVLLGLPCIHLYAVGWSCSNQRSQESYQHFFVEYQSWFYHQLPFFEPSRVAVLVCELNWHCLVFDIIYILRQDRIVPGLKHFMFSMFIRYFRYCTLFDSLEDFILLTNGLFVSGGLKRICKKLTAFWLYPKYLRLCDFSKNFDFSDEFCFRLTIISGKGLTIRIRRNLWSIYIIKPLFSGSGSISHVIIFDCIVHAMVLYLLWQFCPIFGFRVTWLRRFFPCLHFSSSSFCLYML